MAVTRYKPRKKLRRGDTAGIRFYNIGDLTGWTDLWFTTKLDHDDTDAEAQVQIQQSVGLLIIAGAAAAVAANGSITVNNVTRGDLTVVIAAIETAKLTAGKHYYDIQMTSPSGVSTLVGGEIVVVRDVPQVTS